MEISRLPAVQDNLSQAEAISGNNVQSVNASYGANLSSDEVAFQDSLAAAAGPSGVDGISPMAEAVFEPFGQINREAADLAEFAKSAIASENTLAPGEMIALTVRSQQFMFHSQLTANIANRTADGVQQLFRQQS